MFHTRGPQFSRSRVHSAAWDRTRDTVVAFGCLGILRCSARSLRKLDGDRSIQEVEQ